MSDKDKAVPVGETGVFAVTSTSTESAALHAAYQRAQQPQSAEAVASQKPSVLKDCNVRYSISTTPQPSAGVVMPDDMRELLKEVENHLDNIAEFDPTYRPDTMPLNISAKLLIRLRVLLARLNGKEVGRG